MGRIWPLVFSVVFICLLLGAVSGEGGASVGREGVLPEGLVTFSLGDGPLTAERVGDYFGNGRLVAGRDHATVEGGVLRVRYPEGQKVDKTGLALIPRLEPARQYSLSYRIRYPEGFETGLHGKQLGLSGGAGYTGGRSEEARTLGDGWSVRLQFDARDEGVTNQLYVYHCEMPKRYGDDLGTSSQRFVLERGRWHTIRMRVTMQSSAEVADGRIEVWQDDELRFDLEGLRLVREESGRWIEHLRVELFPGGGGVFPSGDMFVEIDDLSWSRGVE